MMKKFDTEVAARQEARTNHKRDHVSIVASPENGGNGGPIKFYLEDADSSVFIRNFERQVFSGKGKDA